MGFDLSKDTQFNKALYQYFTGAEFSRNRCILMHNRMGIRLEKDIDLCNLLLWVAPGAGSSLSYKDRNFSCRDDFTSLFDNINFIDLNPDAFIKCDYDPFYSILHYTDMKLHILSLYDAPVIIIKVEGNCGINLKSNKEDTEILRNSNNFIISHPDRGYNFVFASALSGSSNFTHQTPIDSGRSIFARANMNADDFMVLSFSLAEDNQTDVYASLCEKNFDDLVKENTAKIKAASKHGQICLNDDKKAEHLLQLNKEILISAQDASGAIQAAFKRIYYLIWVRDGSMIWALSSYAGMSWTLQKWTDFLLANPTDINENGKTGRTFTQMVNKISKWQEDGTFYAVWAAFTHWTQTGNRLFCSPEYIKPLEDSVDWIEMYAYDNALGLFGRYYYCETALQGSRDNGWDNAVGKPQLPFKTLYEGQEIVRSYDIYINAYMHSVYLMLSAMERDTNPEQADYNLSKANRLAEKMDFMFDGENLPKYGYLKTVDDTLIEAGPFGMDETDYEWALSLAMFLRTPLEMSKYRKLLYRELTGVRRSGFVAGKASVFSGMDTEFIDESEIIKAINYIIEQSYEPGEYLTMPNTIVEMVDATDGDIFHDVRPQMFSISAVLAAVTGLGIRKLPFGLAVRATSYLSSVSAYEYLGYNIDFIFEGRGPIDKIYINDVPLELTRQIPVNSIRENCVIKVVMSDKINPDKYNSTGVLISSTLRLNDAGSDTLRFTAYGQNFLLFKNLVSSPTIQSHNKTVEFTTDTDKDYTLISFRGTGEYTVTLR